MDSSRAKTPSRLLLTVAFTLSALLLGIIGAVAAGTGTVTPPPKIAFVAAGGGFPDALAVGPMAGRLGAPLYLTGTSFLSEPTKNALAAYNPDLVIVAGGPNTINDSVLVEISTATGLTIKDYATKPATGIVRAAGEGREGTAVAVAELLDGYNPNFLPVDATATDSDLLDGLDSTAFLGATDQAVDADKLDGLDSTAFLGATDQAVDADKLDGLDSAHLMGSWHEWTDGFSSTFDSTGNPDLIGVDVSLDDPCGGGTTVHTLHATFTGNLNGSTPTFAAGVITTDDEIFAPDELLRGYPTSYSTWFGDGVNSTVETPWVAQRVLELSPGDYRIRFGAKVQSGGTTPDIVFPSLVVNRVAITCN